MKNRFYYMQSNVHYMMKFSIFLVAQISQCKQFCVLKFCAISYLVHLKPKFVHKKLYFLTVPFFSFYNLHSVMGKTLKDLFLLFAHCVTGHVSLISSDVQFLLCIKRGWPKPGFHNLAPLTFWVRYSFLRSRSCTSYNEEHPWPLLTRRQ